MRNLNLLFHPNHDVFNWSRDLDRFFGNTEDKVVTFTPPVDIEESENQYVVTLDVPGVAKENIKIEVHNRVLTVSGEKKSERTEKSADFHLTERVSGKFERRFTLPENVNADKVEAKHEHGVLSLTIPKSEAAKPKLVQIN